MLGISKVMIIVAIVITSLMHWATSNVFRYNFTIEKKTNELNIIAAELVPALPLTEVYYFRELNCNDVNLTWDYERVIRNFNALSVLIYQQLTTDIKALHEETLNNLKTSKASNTLRAYKSDFKDFATFCAKHRFKSMPTDPK